MSLICHNAKIAEDFLEGNSVFKITAEIKGLKPSTYEVHMVVSKEDYEKRLNTHEYTPLLYAVSLETRLAYLYDCLNRQFNKPREQKFIFWWRKVGQSNWSEWFTVLPHGETFLDV